MTEKNNSFVFYRSFYDALLLLDNDDKSDYIKLICELAFNGVEPDFNKTAHSVNVKIAYTITAEQIKASIKHKINGAKGGIQKGLNNKNSGVNSPLNTNVNVNEKVNVNVKENVNVNEKVNVNVKENVNVNDSDIHTFLETNNLKDFFINYGYKFVNRVLENIKEKGSNFSDPEKAFKTRAEYINTKYKDLPISEKQGLFYSSLEWETIPEIEEPKEKKETKKTNLDIYKNAPKTCHVCGSKLIKWAGVPGALICPGCRDNGSKIFWEVSNNEWICNKSK